MRITSQKNFITVFMAAQNIHCYKDVGMIPRTMSKEQGYTSYLVCRGKGQYDCFEDLKLITLGRNHVFSEIKLVIFIISNAKNIDVLNLYGLGRHTFIIGKLFKLTNSNGKLYVKSDMGDKTYNYICNNLRAQRIGNSIMKTADLVTSESYKIVNAVNNKFNKRVEYIPNGYFSTFDDNDSLPPQKVILTVGRLGAEEKATENLVDAFSLIADRIPDWRLMLVGSRTKELEQHIKNLKQSIKSKIITTGEIIDKNELKRAYSSASIFVLPSKHENFSISMIEALGNGCYFIGTDGITPIYDIVIDEEIGKVVATDNVIELSNAILDTIKENKFLDNMSQNRRKQYTTENYSWSIICKRIEELINIR